MVDIKKIVKDILSGELTRENDESYAEGFWDLAGEVQHDYDEETQEAIYNALWEVAEAFLLDNKQKNDLL